MQFVTIGEILKEINPRKLYVCHTHKFSKMCIACRKEYTISVSSYDYERYLNGKLETSYDYLIKREIEGCFCNDCITKNVTIDLIKGELKND